MMTKDQALDIRVRLKTAMMALKSAREAAPAAFSIKRGDIPADLELVRAIDILFQLDTDLARFIAT